MFGVTCGSFSAASGPLADGFFLPTRVGTGGSYFFFSSFLSRLPEPIDFGPVEIEILCSFLVKRL